MRVMIIFLTILFFIPLVSAATIHGNVYDINLNDVNDAVVAVNTEPQQLVVAKEGSYSLILEPGTYVLTAKQKDAGIAQRNIIIRTEGDYTLDLILFPSLELEEEFFNETDISLSYESLEFEKNNKWMYASILLLILIGTGVIYVTKRFASLKREEVQVRVGHEKNELQKMVNLIKSEGNKTTQKTIRQKLPYSEAKISLILSALEKQGKIRKIREGNKNIIVLV